tara:strand:+ start:3188 stop:3382 length:195 start_codon:yes stop_codon:yes gene_type:complete
MPRKEGVEMDGDTKTYIEHCKINYLSPFNDGYTRDYYRGELLRLKESLEEPLMEIVDTLDSKPD